MLGISTRCTGRSLIRSTAPAAPRTGCACNSSLTAKGRAANRLCFAFQRPSVRLQASKHHEELTLVNTEGAVPSQKLHACQLHILHLLYAIIVVGPEGSLNVAEQPGGAVLYHFGTEDEKAAAKQQGSAAEPEGQLEAESNAVSTTKDTIDPDRTPLKAAVSEAADTPARAAPAEQEPEVVHNQDCEEESHDRLASHKVT